ncbi:unnamed protein product [Amoebophrya sp. A120]|nr:unnamed protein product [Amoebophrya sp. A120]|eukprot:GSA120T00005479001.1
MAIENSSADESSVPESNTASFGYRPPDRVEKAGVDSELLSQVQVSEEQRAQVTQVSQFFRSHQKEARTDAATRCIVNRSLSNWSAKLGKELKPVVDEWKQIISQTAKLPGCPESFAGLLYFTEGLDNIATKNQEKTTLLRVLAAHAKVSKEVLDPAVQFSSRPVRTAFLLFLLDKVKEVYHSVLRIQQELDKFHEELTGDTRSRRELLAMLMRNKSSDTVPGQTDFHRAAMHGDEAEVRRLLAEWPKLRHWSDEENKRAVDLVPDGCPDVRKLFESADAEQRNAKTENGTAFSPETNSQDAAGSLGTDSSYGFRLPRELFEQVQYCQKHLHRFPFSWRYNGVYGKCLQKYDNHDDYKQWWDNPDIEILLDAARQDAEAYNHHWPPQERYRGFAQLLRVLRIQGVEHISEAAQDFLAARWTNGDNRPLESSTKGYQGACVAFMCSAFPNLHHHLRDVNEERRKFIGEFGFNDLHLACFDGDSHFARKVFQGMGNNIAKIGRLMGQRDYSGDPRTMKKILALWDDELPANKCGEAATMGEFARRFSCVEKSDVDVQQEKDKGRTPRQWAELRMKCLKEEPTESLSVTEAKELAQKIENMDWIMWFLKDAEAEQAKAAVEQKAARLTSVKSPLKTPKKTTTPGKGSKENTHSPDDGHTLLPDEKEHKETKEELDEQLWALQKQMEEVLRKRENLDQEERAQRSASLSPEKA